MKKSLIIVLFFIFLATVFFLNFGAAQTCDNNVIFKISGNDNAHAALCYDTTYSVNIRYSDYFQGTAEPGARDSGLVLRLASQSNSHAEAPNGIYYANFVNYNDIERCELIDRSRNCTSIGQGYTRIIFLSSSTNAHVGLGIYNSNYQNKLCCKARTDLPICDGDGICEGNENQNNCDDCDGGAFCGNGNVEGNEQCDPPGGQAQCQSGYTCNSQCQCQQEGGGGDGGESDCGDGDLDSGEECDGNVFRDYGNGIGQCNEYDSDYESGDLKCFPEGHNQECKINATGCVNNDGGGNERNDFCSDPPLGYKPHNIQYQDNDGDGIDDGQDYPVNLCNDYNKILDKDGYGNSLSEFQNKSCKFNCAGVESNEGYCDWFEGQSNECQLVVNQGDGKLCRIEYLYEGSCGAEDTSRNITIIARGIPPTQDSECDAGCGLGQQCIKEVPCPRVIQLPFFNGINFVISLLIIGAIYLYLINKK